MAGKNRRIGLYGPGKDKAVEDLRVGIEAARKVSTAYPINGPEYRAAGEVSEAILKLAKLLTDDEQIFRVRIATLHAPMEK